MTDDLQQVDQGVRVKTCRNEIPRSLDIRADFHGQCGVRPGGPFGEVIARGKMSHFMSDDRGKERVAAKSFVKT